MQKNQELRDAIKQQIAEIEKLKSNPDCPLIVATALFSAYVNMNEALYRLSTGRRSKDKPSAIPKTVKDL